MSAAAHCKMQDRHCSVAIIKSEPPQSQPDAPMAHKQQNHHEVLFRQHFWRIANCKIAPPGPVIIHALHCVNKHYKIAAKWE